jgi:osmotically-inducible protein OsmY
MKTKAAFLAGIAVGAGAMYMLDPDRGTRRRALARDQLVSAGHSLEDTVSGLSKDARNRAQGLAHETRARMTEGDVEDSVLVERVRSELGRATSHPRSVVVSASNGQVTLSGPVLASEVDALVASVAKVRGVKGVENQLDVHDAPGNIPELQTH